MLNDLINSVDNSLNNELLAMLKQIDMSSNNIPNFRDSVSDLEKNRDFLGNRL